MIDYLFRKRIDFNNEFRICPTHFIMNMKDYQKVRLLNVYTPSCQTKDLKERLFGLEIIITDIEEIKCAVLY